ncbi:MAG: Wzz/FepE/Etk N-terminal domain-containing protein, partial [Bacteroidota bacterium]
MPPPPFPPEIFQAGDGALDYDRAAYHYGPPRRPPSDFATQLREWVDILIRGKWLILGALAAVAIPVAIYTFLAPNVYQASAKLYVETDDGGPLDGVLPTAGGQQAFGQSQEISNELYILQNAEDLSLAVAQNLLAQAETAGAGTLTVL